MKVRETRRICVNDLFRLCVENEWYTRGTNQEYTRMIEFARDLTNVTAENLVAIAAEIKHHSDTEQSIESICHLLALLCFSTFEITN